jgi:hypothetical protein
MARLLTGWSTSARRNIGSNSGGGHGKKVFSKS